MSRLESAIRLVKGLTLKKGNVLNLDNYLPEKVDNRLKQQGAERHGSLRYAHSTSHEWKGHPDPQSAADSIIAMARKDGYEAHHAPHTSFGAHRVTVKRGERSDKGREEHIFTIGK